MTTETERAVVTTYVPEYQKAAWQDHADDLDMSQSEFVRTMVQAGRRGFGDRDDREDPGDPSSESNPQGSRDQNGEIDGLERTVLEALSQRSPLGWEDLLEEVVGDIEDDLEETIEALQRENRITHNPRQGGYVLLETDE